MAKKRKERDDPDAECIDEDLQDDSRSKVNSREEAKSKSTSLQEGYWNLPPDNPAARGMELFRTALDNSTLKLKPGAPHDFPPPTGLPKQISDFPEIRRLPPPQERAQESRRESVVLSISTGTGAADSSTSSGPGQAHTSILSSTFDSTQSRVFGLTSQGVELF
ncbi:hypothetical protein PRZ48_008038 [Zasmidium cellare]|uniref:Uncharacterized protein n=1 Tax=Zasmidium cellare TaxID=395010 RepID=A0ABR0EEH0_ZASCE|nr:hypothetical protein PRZ48_008038 [Zasmidium cellare]